MSRDLSLQDGEKRAMCNLQTKRTTSEVDQENSEDRKQA